MKYIDCPCGSSYNLVYIKNHERGPRHKKYINKLNYSLLTQDEKNKRYYNRHDNPDNG